MTVSNEQPPEYKLPQTASGLDEQQIHPDDIATLNTLFKSNSVVPGVRTDLYRHTDSMIEPGLLQDACHEAELELASPRNFSLRIVPLPARINTRQVNLRIPRIRLRKDVKAVLDSPVLRRKQHPDDLPRSIQKNLYEAIFRRYGDEARSMEVKAVFAHIPPEAVQSIKLGPQLEAATFIWPENLPVSKAKDGHYLVILEQTDGKTRNVIFRLE